MTMCTVNLGFHLGLISQHDAMMAIARLAVVVLSMTTLVMADHDSDWFRTTPAGKHGALDITRDISNQVLATTCLPDAFVRVNGDNFEVNGQRFIAIGWNQWEVLEQASDAGPPARHLPLPGREHIIRVFNEGVATGMKVVRFWAHTITKGYAAQKSAGVWNENILESLDFVMDEARKRGLRVILVLADNWYSVGGVDQYVEMSPTASKHQDFYTDQNSRRLFMNMINTITNRRNSINSRRYGDDPTIMAYNLVNEARCQGCQPQIIGQWVNDMCTFLKKRAPNTLVGLGYEGFFDLSDSEEERALNPGIGGSTWAAEEGQSWARHSKLKCIDFASIHVWPDNWQPKTVTFMRQYIQSHIDMAARSFNKPFLLEEFGKIVEDRSTFSERNKYFAAAFDLAEQNARQGKLAGSLFWHWYDRGVGLTSKYGIHSDESTWSLVTKHVDAMNAITGARQSCSVK